VIVNSMRKPIARTARWRPACASIALAAASVVSTLVVAEVALRAWEPAEWGDEPSEMLARAAGRFPPPFAGTCEGAAPQAKLGEIVRPSPDPDLIYELKPDVDTCYYGARLTTNSAGFRVTGGIRQPERTDAYRVLLLGDSQTFGQGVPFEQSFGELLASSLAQRTTRHVEAINTGVDGYTTVQEAAMLRTRGLALDPDCILVLFVGNDMDLPAFLLEPRDFSLRHWLLTDRLERLIALAEADDEADAIEAVTATERSRVPAEYAHLVGERAYRSALRQMVELADDVPLVNFADYSVRRSWRGLVDFQEGLGILVPPFEYPAGPDYWLSEENQHLSSEGHRVLARRMLAGLEKVGVCLPSTS
jgi:lysophospholipase L1-like esterase